MPGSAQPPAGYEIWIVSDLNATYDSDGTWGTDGDLMGDPMAGVDSLRLLGANRAAVAGQPFSVVTGETYFVNCWVKASSIAANCEVVLRVANDTDVNADFHSGGVVLFAAVLNETDAWQKIGGWVSFPGIAGASRLIVAKGSSSFTVHVGYLNMFPAPPLDHPNYPGGSQGGAGYSEIGIGNTRIMSGSVVLDDTSRLSIRGTGANNIAPGRLRIID